ncbi:aminoglycoside phosphotransferase family protein [Kitasatospora sp. NPDC088391]|uniref:aminoglycoside phosphotransferase family protein n=1 Tax=Kitasatospora sp. NPDC088391 TaxID=3364074 RepID=UPI00380A368D
MTPTTPDKPFPSELRDWVAGHLSGRAAIEDRSWPRSTSRVWHVHTEDGTGAYVKISPSAGEFEREVAGYAYAAAYLDDTQAPRLLAADPGLLAILSTPLPGRVVRGLTLPAATEQRLYEDAGRLLRRWHDASAPDTDADRAAVRADLEEQAREAADCLEPLAPYLDPDRLAPVEAAAKELVGLAEQLPLVFRHGDYETRNWLYDETTGRHGLIDFSTAAHGVAAAEFVWLFGAVWAERPDLREAYFTGYGRLLTGGEDRLLQLLTVRLGASYLRNGLIKQREDLIARGHLVLDRMTAHRP